VELRHEKLRRGSLSVQDPSRDITTAWVQQEFRAGARLTLTGGFRYDDFSDFGSEWSPKVSATFELAPRQRVRASAGHGYRPPYFGELYLYTPPSFVGNPDLEPETANTYSAGYSWAASRFQISADYFHADVTNGITFDLSQLPYTYANLRAYTSKGTNISGAVTLPGGFTPSASYTYTNREDSAGVKIGGVATHAGSVRLLWANERLGLRANIRGDFMGAQPPATDGTYQPAYQVWNSQVAVRILRRGANAVSLYAQVGNLFNEKDVFLYGADGQPIQGNFQAWIAPRTFLAGVTVDMGGR
jgi:outer membrane receptor protein involved in Fe transport